MSNPIKTIFIGTSDFGVPSLEALVKDKDFDIVHIITRPDKPVGRKQILTPPPIKIFAQKYAIPTDQPAQISNFQFPISNPDLIVLIAYGQIIPAKLLVIPKYGAINIHGSLLPLFRGAACIAGPILAGHKTTGITIMKMDEGLDTGPVISQLTVPIEAGDTAGTLHDKLARLSGQFLPIILKQYIAGELVPRPQNDRAATYAPKLTKNDGHIDWSKPAEEIERFVRAMTPWPGAWSRIADRGSQIVKQLKILDVKNIPLEINDYKPGQIFKIENKLKVQCGQGALVINKLQLEGKKAVSGEEFIRGYKSIIGTILS